MSALAILTKCPLANCPLVKCPLARCPLANCPLAKCPLTNPTDHVILCLFIRPSFVSDGLDSKASRPHQSNVGPGLQQSGLTRSDKTPPPPILVTPSGMAGASPVCRASGHMAVISLGTKHDRPGFD